MRIIMKPASTLVFGEFLAADNLLPRRLFIQAMPRKSDRSIYDILTIDDQRTSRSEQVDIEGIAVEIPGSMINLKLTPAQQRAEELLALVRAQVAKPQSASGFEYDAQKLLDKIDPPKPPTLDEALKIAHDLRHNLIEKREADGLLDRARRAGMLP